MTTPDLSSLLAAAGAGDRVAAEQLLSLVYAELRALARAKMAGEPGGHTLQPTALVHEAWLRIGGQPYANRAHFFGAAAEAMRRLLIERARRKACAKRGSGIEHVPADAIEIHLEPGKEQEVLAIHEALDALAAADARKAQVVKHHYFVGLTFVEIAEVLGVSEPTVRRDWQFARAWLARFLGPC